MTVNSEYWDYSTTPPKLRTGLGPTDASGNLLVGLATKIAGEDLANDRIKISNETVLNVVNTENATPLTAGASHTSLAIASTGARRYSLMGLGSGGAIQLLLQVSPDGVTWFWHPNGQTGSTQFPGIQIGDIVFPWVRVVSSNTSGAAQNVSSWVALSQ